MTCSSDTRELLTFWLAGSLSPGEAARVAGHIATCAECREAAREGAVLVKGLESLHLEADEVVSAAAGDLHSTHLLVCSRCRDEVALLRGISADLAATGVRAGWTPSRRAGLAAAAAIIISAPVVWRVVRPTPDLLPAAAVAVAVGSTPATTAPPARRRIVVEKPSLAALANETIVLRGKRSPRRALLEDLALALEPYRRDDFKEAEARLVALRSRHPGAPEIAYYSGLCLLQLDQPAEALALLQEAASGMTPADEARYYLAVARVNAARTAAESESGEAELARLCGGGGEVAARACAVRPPFGGKGPR